MPKKLSKLKLTKVNKMPKRAAAAPKGVPRHEVVQAAPRAAAPTHRDATKESITAYLQPFTAYEERMMGGLPVATQAQGAYGFWTRNVINFTDVPYSSGPNAGTWVAVSPWDINQLVVANGYSDPLGTPNSYNTYNDPFYSAMATNFESIVCAYQGIRIKNLTPVLEMAGESFVGRYPVADSVKSYTAHRIAGTNFVKSNADPGVMLSLNYEGTPDLTPELAGNVHDYSWNLPSAAVLDQQSTRMLFRSQSAADHPQSWELEVVTYYLARPFANTSVFFAPVKHEVDMKTFDKAVDRALAASPEFSVERNAIKDDGPSAVTTEDLQAIWGGAKSVAKVASAAWSGLKSFFGFDDARKLLVHLSLLESEEDRVTLLNALSGGSVDQLRAAAFKRLARPVFTPAQQAAIEEIVRAREESKQDFELVGNTPRYPSRPALRVP